jgi:hypothetical protein
MKKPDETEKRIAIRNVEHLLGRARAKRDAWIAKVNAEPVSALEWAREGVEATITTEACEHALRALENGADLAEHATAQALRFGLFPVASTGLLDAAIQAFRVAAWARIAEAAQR